MRTARRYLAREIYRSSAVVLVALIGLFTFFALIEELDSVSAQFTLWNLFYLQALALPARLYDLLPIGVLIGAILALAGLAQRNELVILRVSGVSGLRLLGMLWIATAPLVVGAFLLSEYITPAAELKTSEASLTLLGRAGGGRLNSGYWFKEADANGHIRMFNIGALSTGGNVSDVTLYELSPGQELERFSQARSGQFSRGLLTLNDITQTSLDRDALSTLANAQPAESAITRVEHVDQRELSTSLTAERLLARVLTPERMSMTNLLDYIDYLDANQLQADRQVVAFWRKAAYPFTLLVMITIAAPISFMQTRRGGVGGKVFIGILLGVGFFMLNQLALNLGMLSQWAPWATALVPNMAALTLALLALLLMENRHQLQNFNRTVWPWSRSAP